MIVFTGLTSIIIIDINDIEVLILKELTGGEKESIRRREKSLEVGTMTTKAKVAIALGTAALAAAAAYGGYRYWKHRKLARAR